MDKTRQIFIDGIPLESIKDDPKLDAFFEEFDDKIFRVTNKKFVTLCKKYDKKATISILIKFEESPE
jgi:hypothetical protein